MAKESPEDLKDFLSKVDDIRKFVELHWLIEELSPRSFGAKSLVER